MPTTGSPRKDSANKTLAEQLADRDVLVDSEVEADTNVGAEQVEVTNGKGDPKAAEKGSVALEKKAVSQNPDDAPEQTNPPAPVAPVDEAQAKAEAKLEAEINAARTKAAGSDTE